MANRPFHETISDLITDPSVEKNGLEVLGFLLRITIIPANHDAIASAYRERLLEFGIGDVAKTVDSILAQKPKPMTEEEQAKEATEGRR